MKFTIKTFYLIGAVVMLIAALGSLWNLILIWNLLTIGAKISTIAGGFIFQLLIAGIFLFMYKQTSNIPDMMIQNPDLDKLLDNIQMNDIDNKIKKIDKNTDNLLEDLKGGIGNKNVIDIKKKKN